MWVIELHCSDDNARQVWRPSDLMGGRLSVELADGLRAVQTRVAALSELSTSVTQGTWLYRLRNTKTGAIVMAGGR